MTRFVPVTVLVLLAASGDAGAQTKGMLPNNAAIVFEHREIFDDTKQDGTFFEPQSASPELLHYFNLAHCNCAKANSGVTPPGTGTFNYTVRATATTGLNGIAGVFYAGTGCEDASHLPGGSAPSCKPLSNSAGEIDTALFPGGSEQNFNLFEVAIGDQATTPMACPQSDNITNSIYFLVNTMNGGNSNFDFASWQPAGKLSGDTGSGSGIDTKPPPLPTEIRAAGSDGGIRLSWTAPTSNATDVYYYQALCANVDGTPARARSNDVQYVTTQSLCNQAGDPELQKAEITMGELDMPVDKPEGDFGALAAAHICGQSSPGTATSLDIKGLSNGTQYQVILLSVDLHGNYQGTYLSSTVTPVPSTDFWEDIHDRGSKVEGGLCLLAEAYGDDSALTGALRAFRDDTLARSRIGRWLVDAYYATLGKLGAGVHRSVALQIVAGILLAPLVALALAWHGLTLPGLLAALGLAWLWRRRRPIRLPRWLLRVAPAAAALAVVLVSGRASAGGYQPYWENSNIKEDDEQSLTDQPGDVTWHVGIRVGPYVPDIDKQFSGSPGPYEEMFGGYRILPMLDVDRILWSRMGQVGVGLSIGFMQKTARTFALGMADPGEERPRAADENKFRLIPMALTGTYRFTWFDDNYGVPVVPYVRGGLAYYLWWVSVNGSLAEVCRDAEAMPPCDRTKALGASFGLTGSIGLAIRAERIDGPTAMSMQQSGIQHAGIYAELSLAKVDGFGSDSKLSVGDATWFAGVNFEF
jgi:hypothetical protein